MDLKFIHNYQATSWWFNMITQTNQIHWHHLFMQQKKKLFISYIHFIYYIFVIFLFIQRIDNQNGAKEHLARQDTYTKIFMLGLARYLQVAVGTALGIYLQTFLSAFLVMSWFAAIHIVQHFFAPILNRRRHHFTCTNASFT